MLEVRPLFTAREHLLNEFQPWITPSIFENTGNDDILDEYTFGQMQNPQTALSVLENHWQTWIVEDDFKQMKSVGLNHVRCVQSLPRSKTPHNDPLPCGLPLMRSRIPLGYWSIPLTAEDTKLSTNVSPYIPGAWPYFLQALNWAKSYSLNVIVDIHGAPGSQNGYDNSGQRIPTPMWASNQSYVQKTIDCITFLVTNAGDKIDILEVMNEPAGFLGDDFTNVLRQYYVDSYNAIRTAAVNGTGVMLSDGFRGLDVSTPPECVSESMTRSTLQYWQGSFNPPQYQGTSMDIVCSVPFLFSYPLLTVAPKSTCTKSSAMTSFLVPSINISHTHATWDNHSWTFKVPTSGQSSESGPSH